MLSFILCYPNISSKATYLQSRHLKSSQTRHIPKPFENKELKLHLSVNSAGVTAIILYLQYFANSKRLKSHQVITPLISETLSSLGCNTAAVSAEQQRKAKRARRHSCGVPRRRSPAPSVPALPPHARELLWSQQGRTTALPATATTPSPRG